MFRVHCTSILGGKRAHLHLYQHARKHIPLCLCVFGFIRLWIGIRRITVTQTKILLSMYRMIHRNSIEQLFAYKRRMPFKRKLLFKWVFTRIDNRNCNDHH